MNIKYLKSAFAALILSLSTNATAGLIDVEFDFGWNDNHIHSGSFQGEDVNNDSLLTFDELTIVVSGYYGELSLSDMTDFGDFEIPAENWIPNAVSWNSSPETAYMTFNENLWSCSTYNGCGVTITSISGSTSEEIPEPSTIAIFALGILSLTSRRLKK